MRLNLCLQATTPLWIYTQNFTALPRTQLFMPSLKADLSVCAWAKSGIAFPAAFFYLTSQCPRCLTAPQCLIIYEKNIFSFNCITVWKFLPIFSSWQLHFIQSEFKGQLPQPYALDPQATQIIPLNMNDQNLEEPSRYVSSKYYLLCELFGWYSLTLTDTFLHLVGGFTPVPLFSWPWHRWGDATWAKLLSQQRGVEHHRL